MFPASRDLVAPHGDQVHSLRTVSEHHQLVFVWPVPHQGRRGSSTIGDFHRREAYTTLVGRFPGTAGFVSMELAIFVDNQTVHVLVGGDIHRATIDFRAGGEGVEEHLVIAFKAVTVDQFQGVAIEGGDGATHGVDHQVTIEGHAHAEGGVHRHTDSALGPFVIEQRIWQLHFLGQFHPGSRVFGVVLVDAEHTTGTGADKGVIAGQDRIDSATQ
ncbi:hypothetical protein D3C72_1440910 [compost metagenome]